MAVRNWKRKKRKVPSKKAFCRFCKEDKKVVDYKDIVLLYRLTTPQGKILGRKRLGPCAKHQRLLKRAIKRSRMIGLMPFVQLY